MLGGVSRHSMVTVVPDVPLAITRSSVQRTRDPLPASAAPGRPMGDVMPRRPPRVIEWHNFR
jgi:hypothetical protein